VQNRLFAGRELPAAGLVVSAITLDSAVVLALGENREQEFRLENDISLVTPAGELVVHFGPYEAPRSEPTHITELASIVNHKVVSACAFDDGVLELSFDIPTVRTLRVQPLSKFEAWTYWDGRSLMVCPPGGQLSR
jgi:hypothetical protein